jgi:polynucleotide 5'-hydroxyl-kinase GRC3/NOL9
MTAVLGTGSHDGFPPHGPAWRWFVGAVTPRGHMLELITGAARLIAEMRTAGAETIVYDTCGLIDPAQGGGNLKRSEIDLLQPAAVMALQRNGELEHLLVPWRVSRRVRIIDVQPSRAARRREVTERQNHRARQFRSYFAGAQLLAFDWRRLGVFPAPRFAPRRLVALEGAGGFVHGLGIVIAGLATGGQVTVLTPLHGIEGITALRVGDVLIDPETGRDEAYSA